MRKKVVSFFAAVAVPLGLLVANGAQPALGAGVGYNLGDVFAGVGHGIIKHFDNQGNLLDTLNTGSNSTEDTGMCFDALGNLRSTNFEANDMSLFDNHGNLTQHPWAGPFDRDPESCLLNATSTNVFVGQADGTRHILEFDTSGNKVAEFSPATGPRGTDWIDLSADQSTIYYTSEGNTIRRFNIVTNTQLPDFADGIPSSPCYAQRIRAGGDVMVACTDNVFDIAPGGVILHTYPKATYGETSFFFALNLDPDGKSFWTAGYSTGNIYRIDIATGALIKKFNAGITVTLAGLSVFGEQTVGGPPPTDPAITAKGVDIKSTEGQNFSGTVATFTDPDPKSMATEYNATIDWGDTTSSPGTITGPTGGPFTVKGDHVYAEEGTYTVKVTITDTDNTSNTATASPTATVADAALKATCATPPFSAEAFAGPTAAFTDDNKAAPSTDFTATIDWGDGTSSPGTVSGGGGSYTVSGTHTYSSSGTFTITTTITDDGGSTANTKPGCTVTVFAFATSNGATFLVGDETVPPTNLSLQAYFWGSQWDQMNPMSGPSPSPSQMKGFAGFENNVLGLPPACGGTWTTDPGNSSGPPPTVPAFLAVIVTSNITQNGSDLSGDIKHIVIVKTNPGYAPDPGSPGTGTIVGEIC